MLVPLWRITFWGHNGLRQTDYKFAMDADGAAGLVEGIQKLVSVVKTEITGEIEGEHDRGTEAWD